MTSTITELAGMLENRREEIVAKWIERVVADARIVSAKTLPLPALRDHIPQMLEQLVASLDDRAKSTHAESLGRRVGHAGMAQRHAHERFLQGYSIDAALRELSHLRAIVVEVVMRDGATLDTASSLLLHAAIDEAMETVAREIERAARTDLTEALERLRVATDAGRVSLLAHRFRTNEQQWDGCAPSTIGLPDGVFVDRSMLSRWIHPDDLERVLSVFSSAREVGGEFDVEFRVVGLEDRVKRTVVARGRIDFDERGEPSRLLGTLTDVTEHARLTTAVRESEAQLRSLVDTMPLLAWTAFPDGTIDWFNARWYEFTGTTPDSQLGFGWKSVHVPEDLERVVANYRSALARSEVWEDTFRLRGKDGTYRWFLSRARPLRDADGRVVRWFGTNVDIDDQMRAQASLEREVELRERFVAVLSHDLRQPLGAVSLTSESLLKSNALSDRAVRGLRLIASSANRMQALISDLLDLARMRVGALPMDWDDFDCRATLEALIDEARAVHPARVIELDVRGDGRMRGDAARVSQLVTNLVSNAVDYSPSDTPVRVEVDGSHTDRVLILVQNQGEPIPPEVLPHVFEPYRRGTRTNRAGLGLGLHIAESIAKAHHGSIDVRSDASVGTVFSVVLPRRPDV